MLAGVKRMSRLTPLQMAKRAASHNPAFKTAKVYVTATAEGSPVYTAAGELQYDSAEITLGYIDRSKETVLTLGQGYSGACLVTVLSEVAPNGAALILLDGVFYQIGHVHSADALGTSITYACTSLSITDAPVIRVA